MRNSVKWAAIIFFLLIVISFSTVIMCSEFKKPIQKSHNIEYLDEMVVKDKNKITVFGTSIGEKSGIQYASFEGGSYQGGLALYQLNPTIFMKMLSLAINNYREFCGCDHWTWISSRKIMIKIRNDVKKISPKVIEELSGFTHFQENRYPLYGTPYSVWTSMQLAPAIIRFCHQYNKVSGTGFALGRGVAERRLIAMNLDFEGPDGWDRLKWVVHNHGDDGHALIGVSWPGMFGIVAGLNDRGLGIGLLPGRSSGPTRPGVSAPVLARQILEQCATLEDVVELIRTTVVSTPSIFLVGSSMSDRSLAIEKTADGMGVRESRAGWLTAADFFQSRELAGDLGNLDWKRESAAVGRLQRLQELVTTGTKPITLQATADLLRNHRGLYGARLGWGNRLTINSLRTVQSVILDLEKTTIWVAAEPRSLGPYIPFSIQDPGAETETRLPSDPILDSGAYNEFMVYEQGRRQAEALLKSKRYRQALGWILEVRTLNLEDYRSYLAAGRALLALKQWDEAWYNFNQAKKLQPDTFRSRVEIEAALQELERKITP